jgi:hypothetical protein
MEERGQVSKISEMLKAVHPRFELVENGEVSPHNDLQRQLPPKPPHSRLQRLRMPREVPQKPAFFFSGSWMSTKNAEVSKHINPPR